MQSSWVSEEEFGMGIVDLKTAISSAKSVAGSFLNALLVVTLHAMKWLALEFPITGNQLVDPSSIAKDQIAHAKSTPDRTDTGIPKSDSSLQKLRSGSVANGQETSLSVTATISKTSGVVKNVDESAKPDDTSSKAYTKSATESEVCILYYCIPNGQHRPHTWFLW